MEPVEEPEPKPVSPARRGVEPQVWALLALIVLLFVGSFVYAFRSDTGPKDALVIQSSGAATAKGNQQPQNVVPANSIAVHVTGAVTRPGVYTLPVGSRVKDALAAAGGFTKNADTLAVNQAERLADADMVVVPEKASATQSLRSAGTTGAGRPPTARGDATRAPKKLRSPADGAVNINSASAEELQRLPGVGPAIAARIIAYRTQVGRFSSVDQLTEVSGIGEKKLAAMKPFVRLR
jgi:competence protein ComEA